MDGLQRFVSFLQGKEDEIKKEDFVIPFSNRVRMSIQVGEESWDDLLDNIIVSFQIYFKLFINIK